MTLQRTESFVPLTAAPAPGERLDYHVTVLASGGQAQAFQPLKADQPVPPVPAPTSVNACEPRVSLSREGDRVVSIRVQCSCGQVLDLACVYPEAVK
jgi:hypothetical protein